MIIPHVDSPHLLKTHATITPPFQLDKSSRISFYVPAVTCLLGGNDAISALAAIHIYGNWRMLGWYNTPGSFHIANRLKSLAKSASFRIISPTHLLNDVHLDPTTLIQSEGCKGPRFRAAHSGTVVEETGYLASLLMKECAVSELDRKVVRGRRTQPVRITVANLGPAPASEMHPTCGSALALLFAGAPITVSIGTCVLCAVFGDWYASLLILVGIIASGVTSLVLGSADVVFTYPESAKEPTSDDGILDSGKDVIVLKGTEGAVNTITHGTFSLRFSCEGHYNLIRSCSVLFFIQSASQLILMPHTSLFGQIMFLTSLGVSALYNAWLSSSDEEDIHRKLLFEGVLRKATLTKYSMGSRTVAVVFMLLVLQPRDPTGLLNEHLPDDTKVWRQWKATVLEQLRHAGDSPFLFDQSGGKSKGFTRQEQAQLQLLYDDARAAYIAYNDYLGVNPL